MTKKTKKTKSPKKGQVRQTPRKKVAEKPAFSWDNPIFVIVGLAAIFLLVFFIRLQFLEIPMERDEGIYTYTGKLVLQGKTPYLDFYEQRFPGTFYFYAIIVMFFGSSLKGVAFGFLLVNLGTIFLLYLLGKRLFDDLAGLVAGGSFALLSMTQAASGFTRQSEHLVTLFVVAGLLLLVQALKSERKLHFLLSGMFFCFAFLTKTNGLFFILLGGFSVLIYYLAGEKPIDFKKMILNATWYSLGVFGTFGILCLLMLLQGALGEMFYWAVEFPRAYVSTLSFDKGMELFWNAWGKISAATLPLWILGFVGIGALFFTKTALYKKIWMPVWIFFACMSITPGMYFYGHYWLMIMPILAILCGASVYAAKELLKGVNPMVGLFVPAILFLGIMFHNIGQHSGYYFSPNYDNIMLQTYGTNPFPESKKLGDFIATRSQPGDEVVLFGSEPQVYLYSGCEAPNKHMYFSYLVQDTTKTNAVQWQEEFKQDLSAEPPRFLVFFNHGISLLVQQNAKRDLFTWVNGFIQQNNYRKIGTVDMLAPGQSNYIFDQNQVNTYQAKGQQNIDIFERFQQ